MTLTLNQYIEDMINPLSLCPVCQSMPEHIAYTYYYGNNDKTNGEYETIRRYVCPKCGFNAEPEERGATKIVKESPKVVCLDRMKIDISRREWNTIVRNKEKFFKHLIKMNMEKKQND